MRILHVVPTYWPAVRYGGPIYSVHELCKGLHQCGDEVHVFTTNVDGRGDSDVVLEEPVDIDGVKVWYFPSRSLRRLYYSPPMRSALKEQAGRFDLVHTHSVFLWPTWAAARIARRVRVPYIVSPRGMLLRDLIRRKSRWKKTVWIRFIEKDNLRNAACTHVTSNTEREGLVGLGLDLPSIVTIPNGIDLPQEATEGKVSEDVARVVDCGPYVLFLGRINWKKGLDRLVRLWRDSINVQLVIAGNDEEGYKDKLTRQIQKENINNVRFIPRFVAGRDKAYLIENASVFVLPSYSENFGNTAVEAMARGIPVIVTEETGCRDIVEASGGGLVLPFERFGPSLVDVLGDPLKRNDMARKGRAYVSAHLGWSHVAKRMQEVYRSAVAARFH